MRNTSWKRIEQICVFFDFDIYVWIDFCFLQSTQESSMKKCIEALIHACLCRDRGCQIFECMRMKRVVTHFKVCAVRTHGTCPICKQLISVCWHHARNCRVSSFTSWLYKTKNWRVIKTFFSLNRNKVLQLR